MGGEKVRRKERGTCRSPSPWGLLWVVVAEGFSDLLLQILEQRKGGFRVAAGYGQLPGVAFGVLDEFDPDGIFVGQVPVHHGQAG